MQKTLLLLLVALNAVFWGNSEARAQDTLYLNNKSVLVGKFKGMALGRIRFKINDASEVSVEIEKVKTLYVVTYVLEIETLQGKNFIGYFDVSDSGRVHIVNIIDTIDMAFKDITEVTTFSHDFFDALTASIGAGYSYTRSSEVGRFNFDGKANYTNQHFRFALSSSFIVTQDSTSFIRDREQVQLTASYYYTPRFFNAALLNYQRNLQLGLLVRTQQGLVVGGRVLARPKMQLSNIIGMVINQETNTSGTSSGLLYEIPVALTYDFYSNRMPDVRFSIQETVFFGVGQSGRIRQDGESAVAWDFFGDFTLKTTIYHNYDSKPPLSTGSNLDYGFVFGLSYSFN
jgi:hypothetical protein